MVVSGSRVTVIRDRGRVSDSWSVWRRTDCQVTTQDNRADCQEVCQAAQHNFPVGKQAWVPSFNV